MIYQNSDRIFATAIFRNRLTADRRCTRIKMSFYVPAQAVSHFKKTITEPSENGPDHVWRMNYVLYR